MANHNEFNMLYDFVLKDRKYEYNNMDVHRYLSYFPVWSSAHRNFFSNASKLLSPICEQITASVVEVENLSVARAISIPFGYREFNYTGYIADKPKAITTEYGTLAYLGEAGASTIESIPIEWLKDTPIPRIKKVSESGTIITNMVLVYPSTLYISSDNISDNISVSICGVKENGAIGQEEVLVARGVAIETMSRYSVVLEAVSTNGPITVANYLDLSLDHSYSNAILPDKKICDLSGQYFEPAFELEDNDLVVYNRGFTVSDEYKFQFINTPSAIFINDLLDIIALEDGWILASKLMLDYYNIPDTNSSVNNNDFICVQDEHTSLGETCQITINTNLIKEEINTSRIKIGIKNKDEMLYLSSSMTLEPEYNTWITLDTTGNQIIISLPINNLEPYIYSLELDGVNNVFYAISACNKLNFKRTNIGGVTNLMIYNGKLVAELDDTSLVSLEAIRGGFITSGNTAHLPWEFSLAEAIY